MNQNEVRTVPYFAPYEIRINLGNVRYTEISETRDNAFMRANNLACMGYGVSVYKLGKNNKYRLIMKV